MICYLYREKEARFHSFVDELGVPQKRGKKTKVDRTQKRRQPTET